MREFGKVGKYIYIYISFFFLFLFFFLRHITKLFDSTMANIRMVESIYIWIRFLFFAKSFIYLIADITTVVCERRSDSLLLEHLDALRYYPIEESICYSDPTAFYRYWDISLNPCASSDDRLTTVCQCDSW